MEPQATPQPQTPQVSPTPTTPQTKNSLVLIMSVLLIVTVAIAGLFYFQIQKLSKELSKYQAQPSPTPFQKIFYDGETEYVNKSVGISVLLPVNWHLDYEIQNSQISFSNYAIAPGVDGVRREFDPNLDKNRLSMWIDHLDYSSKAGQSVLHGMDNLVHKEILIDGQIAAMIMPSTNPHRAADVVVRHPYKPIVIRIQFGMDAENNIITINQILSTFKFIEATPSASPTATPTSSQ